MLVKEDPYGIYKLQPVDEAALRHKSLWVTKLI